MNNAAVEFAHSSGSYTYGGVISGTGAVNKISGGALTLTGANTYTGNTSVSGGSLTIGATNALPTSTSLNLNSTAVLNVNENQTLAALTGQSTTSVAIATGKSLTINPNSPIGPYDGVISGDGAFVKSGTGSYNLTGANTFTGGTTVNAGRLTLLNTSGSGTGTGNVTVSGGTFTIGGASGGALSGNILNNAAVEFAHTSGSYTYAGVISGTGAVNKLNAGALTLTGANTYTGNTSVSGGSLTIGATNALPTSTSVNLSSTAALNINQNQTLTAITGSSTTSVAIASGKALTISTTATGSQYSGVISGDGSFIKSGSGSFNLTGANTFTGGTTVNAGRLTLLNASGSGAGTGNVTVTGGTFAIGGGVAGGSLSGNIANNAAVEFAHSSGSNSYGGIISGTGMVTKINSTTLTLTGANTYSGETRLFGGTLVIGATNALPVATALNLSGGTTLSVLYDQTIERFISGISSQIQIATAKTFTVDLADNAPNGTGYGGTISGGGKFRIGGPANNWLVTLTGTNTYTGGTQIDAGGGLQIGSNSTFGSITGDVLNNGRLSFRRSDDYTFAGVISGSGVVTNAHGDLKLTAANSYTGGTEISSGAIITSNSSGFGTGTITLNGGSVAATGGISIANTLVINTGGVMGTATFTSATFGTEAGFAPESTDEKTIGTLNFQGLTLASGGTYKWNLKNPLSGAGIGWDLTTVTSDTTLNVTATAGSRFKIEVISLSGDGTTGTATGFTDQTYSWTIFDFSNGTLTNFDPSKFEIIHTSFSTNLGSGKFTLSQDVLNSKLVLNFTPVPEPSTYMLMCVGSLLLVMRFRRKRA